MMDDWFLEHLAKVTTLSCVLIVIYFLVYSTWRIAQMPNYPWNWNDWQWPIGGRHAVEIYRKPTEMPFTLSMHDRHKEAMNQSTLTLTYLKGREPPTVTVLWGPSTPYIMKLINSAWSDLQKELMIPELEENQWNSLLSQNNNDPNGGLSIGALKYFIIQRCPITPDLDSDCQRQANEALDPASELYHSCKFVISPPDFDWNFLKNQYRYPAAVFITKATDINDVAGESYAINGIIHLLHIKNEVFPKASTTLAQYIKMNNGQSHMLQSLFVMDDHRVEDEDSRGTGEETMDEFSPARPEDPFSDILCSVCQVSPVTRVIIPCRHVCLCAQCFEKVEVCPICRGAIMYYFKTRLENLSSDSTVQSQDSENFTWWQRLERWNDRFSDAIGLIRQY